MTLFTERLFGVFLLFLGYGTNLQVKLDLKPCYAKIDRAWRHYQELKLAVATFEREHLLKLSVELDEQNHKYVFRARNVVSPNDETISLIIGDVVHNARVALDYLVYQLTTYKEQGVTEDKAKLCQFPIYADSQEYRKFKKEKSTGKHLNTLHKKDQKQIDQLQPFSEHIWTFPPKKDDLTAMNLVPFLIVVHYNREKYRKVLAKYIPTASCPVKILTDDQAFVVQDGVTKLVGEGLEILASTIVEATTSPTDSATIKQ